jgi:hypothetical protein
MKHISIIRICGSCGATFVTSREDQLYCNIHCKNARKRTRERKYYQALKWKLTKNGERECAVCGRQFTPNNWNEFQCSFCKSRKIRKEINELNEFRVSVGFRPIVPSKVVCLVCGTKFKAWDKRLNRVCSDCLVLGEGEHYHKGKGNHENQNR